jgi:hypothetical protein
MLQPLPYVGTFLYSRLTSATRDIIIHLKPKKKVRKNRKVDTLFIDRSHKRILFSHILPMKVFPISIKYYKKL